MNEITKFKGSYSFLSNFETCFVTYEGMKFRTVEHAFQAAKTLDMKERIVFQLIDFPAEAKQIGKQVKLRPDWEQVKLGIMEDLVRQKFNQPKFKKLLLSTNNNTIVEGNTHGDTFWGVCKNVGYNKLGKIIMKIRDEIKQDCT